MIKTYCVYKHTSPNGKVYVGITLRNPIYRWNNGNGYCNNKYFLCAIKKYGWDNFKHEILFAGLTEEEAEQKEIELIKQYNSTDRNFGYNILKGGNISDNIPKGKNHYNYGKHRTEATKQKLSYAASHISEETRHKLSIAKLGKSTWNKGLKFSEDVCKKMSENRPKKAVLQFSKDGLFINKYESVTEAGKQTNVCIQNISFVCEHKRRSAGGFIWSYAE